jgi:Fe-S oxidoreductase
MALLKAELQYARIRQDGLSRREKLFSSVDRLGRLGCKVPWLANMVLDSNIVRYGMERFLGIAAERPLPHYAWQRFDRWFATHKPSRRATRGRVILWDDSFVRYHEPNIGRAAVKVLEAAGFEVELANGRECCGRPAFSQGNLDEAMRVGAHNVALLNRDADNAPIIFLEPSCYSMFVEDYRELNLPNAEQIAGRCFLFEQFIDDLLSRQSNAMAFNSRPLKVVIHAHCHAKALAKPDYMLRLAEHLPGRTVTLLDTGCCGMAGGFGAMAEKYDLSVQVAEPLIAQLKHQPFGTIVVASGTSCRHQIQHLAKLRPRHMAEVLADAVV